MRAPHQNINCDSRRRDWNQRDDKECDQFDDDWFPNQSKCFGSRS